MYNPITLMTVGCYSFCNIMQCSAIASLTCKLSLSFLALTLSSTNISLMYWSLWAFALTLTNWPIIFSHFSVFSLNWNLALPWKPTSLQRTAPLAVPLETPAGEIKNCSCWKLIVPYLFLPLTFECIPLMLWGLYPYSLFSHIHPGHWRLWC